jgi:hypothetical protein
VRVDGLEEAAHDQMLEARLEELHKKEKFLSLAQLTLLPTRQRRNDLI